MNGAGFPHSEIFGSKRACRSPKLIAACCVLRRLMKPRHPSIAVTGLCKRSHILGVYLTHLHLHYNYPKLSKNKNYCVPLNHHFALLCIPSRSQPSFARGYGGQPPAQPDGYATRSLGEAKDGGPRWT